ncbi:MAG TPA: tRNA (adenosine(37)-N6)-dimethylallyltransferase MiaA [Sphingomonas sp.]|nr:tRNA (adenosine(37)-N6)-dimethylallyltransferase MiaA [Sphingomonas sp.]
MSTSGPSVLPRLALIAGPTASGKSALALDLAERENGVIINADASQVYRDLRILSARPSEADEARAPHLLFGHRDGAEPYSAAAWAAEAEAAIAEVHRSGRLPIVVGGTGLYIRTLIEGIAPIPEIDPAIRKAVRSLPAEAAYAALKEADPPSAARLHPHDTTRLQRALEVALSTGRSVLDWHRSRVGGIAAQVAIEAQIIEVPIVELYARCDARVETMMAESAVEEVAALRDRNLDPTLPVMRAIGVVPLIRFLASELSREQAIAQTKQATRNYAKRQRTWLRHQLSGYVPKD